MTPPQVTDRSPTNGSTPAQRIERKALKIAPLLLALSLGWYVWRLGNPNDLAMIDLQVYWTLSPHLLTGQLYTINLPFTTDFPLPFTYPPFAALAFIPISWLPWLVARIGWQLVSLACLWWLIRRTLTLLAARSGRPWDATWHRRTMFWSALALWCEPVRTTLDFGQINLVLVAVVFLAMTSRRALSAGVGVGVAAGIKLTPAISALYLLATRRFAAAAWSIAAFAATVFIGFLVSAKDSQRYWFELVGAADRVGPVGSAINQSLRGALSRTLGHDVGMSLPWLIAAALAAVLAGLALRAAIRAGDTLAGIVAVQFLGLLVSPISWSHHWIWVIPLVLWCVYRTARPGWLALTIASLWVLATGAELINFLIDQQPTIWEISRPWPLATLGWLYPALALLTLAVMPTLLRGDDGPSEAVQVSPGRAAPSTSTTPVTLRGVFSRSHLRSHFSD